MIAPQLYMLAEEIAQELDGEYDWPIDARSEFVERTATILDDKMRVMVNQANTVIQGHGDTLTDLKTRAATRIWDKKPTIPMNRGEFVLAWNNDLVGMVNTPKGVALVYEGLLVQQKENDS